MRMSQLLEKIGIKRAVFTDRESDVDDQTYSEAIMDNAVVNSKQNVERFARIKEAADSTNEKLANGIERIKIVSADKGQIMASLVRGMKSGNR